MDEIINERYFAACKLIFEHYGEEHQKLQLIQEMAELAVALTKNNLENIIEEMADVQIMLDQFCSRAGYGDKVIEIQQQKIDRQLKRIAEEKKLDTVA